jgi:hypothetical protein
LKDHGLLAAVGTTVDSNPFFDHRNIRGCNRLEKANTIWVLAFCVHWDLKNEMQREGALQMSALRSFAVAFCVRNYGIKQNAQ